MAAFGPPLGHPAAPSKRRPKFVQPLGSTSALGFSAWLIVLPQVFTTCLQRFGNFTVKSVLAVLTPIKMYNFSAEQHKGWAGHPGENRLAGALADALKSSESRETARKGSLQLV